MNEPDNLVLVHLREFRADMNAQFAEQNARFGDRFAAIEKRLDKLDAAALRFMRTFVGHRSMTERTFASFEIQLDRSKLA